MVTDKEHRQNMRRISRAIKATDAQIRKNKMRIVGLFQRDRSKQFKKNPTVAK